MRLLLVTMLPLMLRSAIDGLLCQPGLDPGLRWQLRLEVVGLESPERDQAADAGIEQVVACRRRLAVPRECSAASSGDDLLRLTVGNGLDSGR